ncbi:MAG: VWA domain-containing protein [Deltaproteobacteria bacterium]|nr:VWA domain-containing protein [Deltaproteobacteria bacterium]
MEDRIVEFSDMLRQNGLRVSLSENVDAIRAVELIGIENPSFFKDTLRTTLIKRSLDVQTFDELFDIFFYGLRDSLKDSERRLIDQMGLSVLELQRFLDEIRNWLNRAENELSPLARALLSGDKGRLERLLRDALRRARFGRLQEGPQAGGLSHRIAATIAFGALEEELEDLKKSLEGLGMDPEALAKLSRYVELKLKELSQSIQNLVQQELRKTERNLRQRDREEYLFEKSFSYYTEQDIRRMREVVVKLARRFKNLLSARRRRARKGRFDVQATLRQNLQYGGVPFRVQLEKRRKEKPQVIILCDISDSVLNASRFMLQFVYSMQELYSKVRSFVFVSDLGEVTRLFEENEVGDAVEMALKGDVVDVYSHSNFGRAFQLFYRRYQAAVTGKTTFLIIGDGRNNYNLPNDWVLKEIRQKAKRLIWLNPESRLTWGVGDSEMPRYLPYCHIVEECRNIRQLYKVIDQIVA